MTVVAADALVALLDQVMLLCGHAFGVVEELRATAARAWEGEGLARRRDLAPLEAVAAGAMFTAPSFVVGAGYVAQPGALADEDHWLEWWTADRDSMRRLSVETDPAAPAFRDYTRLPWFQTPLATGTRYVHGPYVDYLCTEEYTLTFTAPVVVGERFRGVVGADVYARTLERRLTPLLEDLPGPVAVVNAQGRVVAGNAAAPVTGDLLRAVGRAWETDSPGTSSGTPDWRLVRRPDLPFGVVVG